MKVENDAFGLEMMAFHRGENVEEIIEREDGYISLSSGPKAYFAPYAEWTAHTQKGMAHVRGRVLDIGCGAGRHALYLQDKGYDVVGIDLSPLAIEVCRERGVKDARVMSITQASVNTLGHFDSIIMLGNNFGLMGSFKRARWLLRRFGRMVGDNGRIIAESRDPYDTTDPLHLAYHAYNRKRGRMTGQIRLRVRFRAVKGDWFDYLLVSKEEMQTIVDGTGWQVNQFIDGDGGVNYTAVLEKQPKFLHGA